MEYNNNYQTERELGWDDVITEDSKEYIILPEGDYEFTVMSVERARSSGNGKIPACNMAKVTIAIDSPQGTVNVVTNLILHSSLEWKVSEFFASLGLKKKGEPFRMNWNQAIGAKGYCKMGRRENNGNTYNDVKRFLPVGEHAVPQPNQQQYTPPKRSW